MICPKCKAEYREGFTRCADCGVPLVDFLPEETGRPEEMTSQEDWVRIYAPASAQELALTKMILDREQIPYFVGSDNTRRAALYSPVNLAFELWVPARFAEQVTRLLREELDIR